MRDDDQGLLPFVLSLAAFVLIVGILRVGQAVMVPIALASLLAFLLSPLVVCLTRRGLGKTMAAVLTSALAFTVIGCLGWIVLSQAMDLARELPKYEENIEAKIARLKVPQATAIGRVADMATKFERELLAPAVKFDNEANAPVRVEVQPVRMSTAEAMSQIAAPVLRPLATAGIVIIFVIAILLQRENLRDRLFRAVNPTRLDVVARAYNDATHRVSRYLRMQLVINAGFGAFVGFGLFIIGIPNFLLWGLFAMLLRFIPFVGPWIAASFPLILAVAIDPGWTKFSCTLGLFVTAELVTANVVEIWLYGASTGISGVALLFAAIFWTWLWGAPGLFLSTPLTVCLMVTGRYVPALNSLSVLLGSHPVPRSTARFYHRLIALDSKELLSLALRFIEERSLAEFYDEVFVPALIMLEEERHAGALSGVRQDFVVQSARGLIKELEGRMAPDAAASGPVVLALPARDEVDELVALMVRTLLRGSGISVEVSPITASPAEQMKRIGKADIRAAFISTLPPYQAAAAAQMVLKLKQKFPELKVFLGLWNLEAAPPEIVGRSPPAPAEEWADSVADLAAKIEKLLGGRPEAREVA